MAVREISKCPLKKYSEPILENSKIKSIANNPNNRLEALKPSKTEVLDRHTQMYNLRIFFTHPRISQIAGTHFVRLPKYLHSEKGLAI